MAEELFDREAFAALNQKIIDIHLSIGLTVINQQVGLSETGETVIATLSIVRKTAIKQVTESKETNDAIQLMAAGEAEARIEAKINKYAGAIKDGSILDLLTGQDEGSTCQHIDQDKSSTIHEGLCLICYQEVADEKS